MYLFTYILILAIVCDPIATAKSQQSREHTEDIIDMEDSFLWNQRLLQSNLNSLSLTIPTSSPSSIPSFTPTWRVNDGKKVKKGGKGEEKKKKGEKGKKGHNDDDNNGKDDKGKKEGKKYENVEEDDKNKVGGKGDIFGKKKIGKDDKGKKEGKKYENVKEDDKSRVGGKGGILGVGKKKSKKNEKGKKDDGLDNNGSFFNKGHNHYRKGEFKAKESKTWLDERKFH